MTAHRLPWTIYGQRTESRLLRDGLAALLSQKSTETSIANTVRAIEHHGCSTEVVAQGAGHEQAVGSMLEVLSLDLAWLSPGPFGTWSEDGRQACYCISKTSLPDPSRLSWYRRALERFFGATNSRSLLTYPDIYTRPVFLQANPLGGRGAAAATEKNPPRGRLTASWSDSWSGSFHPDPLPGQSAEEWEQRHDCFLTALREELEIEFGAGAASDAILVWVYVSDGVSQPEDPPPPWASSLFMLFRFKEQQGESATIIDHNLGLLMTNLLRALEEASRNSLTEPAKHSIAQALSHEFKNLNQDIASLADILRTDFMNIPPMIRRGELETMRDHLEALHLAAQGSTAFSTAAYWLARPDWGDIELRADDEHNSIFKHVLYLAIRLIAATRPSWKLVGIPQIPEIVTFMDRRLGLNSYGSVTQLLSNRCVSIMVFFALEPVRNVRSNCRDYPEVQIWVESAPGKVVLLQRTTEIGKDSSRRTSATVKALMQLARDNPLLAHFIYVEPEVTAEFIGSTRPNVFMAHRRTTIRVDQVAWPRWPSAQPAAASHCEELGLSPTREVSPKKQAQQLTPTRQPRTSPPQQHKKWRVSGDRSNDSDDGGGSIRLRP